MTRRRSTLVVAPAILLLISVSSCLRARTVDSTGTTRAGGAPQSEALLPPPAPPESYIGVQLCRACHPAVAATFAQTKMGRLFLHAPRNAKERHACETCHGPGKAHMQAGGGRGKGELITFARNDPTPIAVRNAICLDCHGKGDRLFWSGSAPLPAVPRPAGPSEQPVRDRCSLAQVRGGASMRELPCERPWLESPCGQVLRAIGAETMRAMRGTQIVVVVALAILTPIGSASAQVSLGPVNLEGDVEAGVRLLPEGPSSANRQKFEEYRDITEGVFLANLQLRIFTPDEKYSIEALGSKWGQQDQQFGFGVGRLGLWNLGFSWDETPHVYSTTARLLESEVARGVFTLPTPRPPLSAYNFGRRLDEVSVRWDTGKLSFSLTPTPDLELRSDYTRIHKHGDRPIGVPFGGPGSNLLETLEPIDQTIHDLRLKANIAHDRWQLQVGYAWSMFDNGNRIVTADNPCFGLPAAVTAAPPGCGADAGGAQPTGGVSLAPSNQAHTWSIAGGVNLPMNTRINASVVYGLRLQNASFLPQTVNPAVVSPLLGLPARSLDGTVATTLVSLQAVTRPLRPFTLTAKYRYYDYNDITKELQFSGRVLNDRFVLAENVKALRPDYTKQNADLDARWRFGSPLAVTVGTGWERWDRNEKVREVPQSDELFGKVVIDYTPAEWLMAHLSYRPSARRIDEYNTWAHYTSLHVDPSTTTALAGNQAPLLRKYDEGERDRHRIDLLLQIVPSEKLSGTINAGWKSDDYVRSPLGLQQATSWSAGADITFVPFERLSVVAGYVREWIFEKQRSRSGAGVSDPDWISDNADTIDTAHIGLRAKLSEALDWTLGATYSTATGTVQTRNPGGAPAQPTPGTAKRFPAFVDSLLRLDTALRYRFRDNWTASLGYVYETFGQHDWRTDTINPFVPVVGSSIFLGNQTNGYDAHIVAVTLGYRFR